MSAAKRKGETASAYGPGAVLADRYRLEESVASGGMGEVWRATDTLLERVVAVKLLREALAHDPVVSERFRREALLAAQISHPNMAGVFDYVQEHDRPGIVMEFVDGETLAERLARDGMLDSGEAVRIGSALLAALQSAHDAGIVHRDVKPGNVMLTANGGVKVTDFGIARATSDHTLTETGMVIGTAHYLAPEQVSGDPATPSSDLYSVGAILYEMLGGRRPFEAETPLAVAMKRLAEEPAPLRSIRPNLSPAVADVVGRALAREPSGRYSSADEMRRALDTAFAASQPATHPHRVDPTPTMVLPIEEATAKVAAGKAAPGKPAVGHPKRRRRTWVVALLAAVAAALLVFSLFALVTRGPGLVKVPNLIGATIQQARDRAAQLGLAIKEVPQDSTQPRGTIVGQGITAGTSVGRDTELELGVSTGNPPAPAQVVVPDVGGKNREEAENVLTAAGFTVKVSEVSTSDFAAGVVMGQYPRPNDMAPQGSEIAIFVAVAPPQGRGKHNGNGGD